ncbi:unnamed protein product, partial [Laminaria digitata]
LAGGVFLFGRDPGRTSEPLRRSGFPQPATSAVGGVMALQTNTETKPNQPSPTQPKLLYKPNPTRKQAEPCQTETTSIQYPVGSNRRHLPEASTTPDAMPVHNTGPKTFPPDIK